MGKKKLVKLVMGNSEMTFEIEERKPQRKRVKKGFRKKEYNLAAISINAERMARHYGLTENNSFYDVVENPMKTRKKETYLSK